jgi:hypothetical protein
MDMIKYQFGTIWIDICSWNEAKFIRFLHFYESEGRQLPLYRGAYHLPSLIASIICHSVNRGWTDAYISFTCYWKPPSISFDE